MGRHTVTVTIPRTPGRLLDEAIGQSEFTSYAAFCRVSGVDVKHLYDMRHSRRPISVESSIRFGRALGMDPAHWVKVYVEWQVQEILRKEQERQP